MRDSVACLLFLWYYLFYLYHPLFFISHIGYFPLSKKAGKVLIPLIYISSLIKRNWVNFGDYFRRCNARLFFRSHYFLLYDEPVALLKYVSLSFLESGDIVNFICNQGRCVQSNNYTLTGSKSKCLYYREGLVYHLPFSSARVFIARFSLV